MTFLFTSLIWSPATPITRLTNVSLILMGYRNTMMSPRCTSSYGRMCFGHRTGRRIGQLVDQQMIANQQRVLHRSGRDHERLHQRGGAKQQQDDGDGPFGDHATRDVIAERLERVLRRCFHYFSLFFSHYQLL